MDRVDRVLDGLRGDGRVLVALSGGIDSTVVAYLAERARPGRVAAATLSGAAVAPREVERARSLAERFGIPHTVLSAEPLTDERYRSNPTNRCYFCRQVETRVLRAWGEAQGILRFVDGVHLDDLGDDRPGLKAMEEAGFDHPLVTAGWRKSDVRAFARAAGIPTWDLPSDACLASRVRHGTPISAALLDRVRAAEEVLLESGFRRVRVRTDGRSARVEVDSTEVDRLLEPARADEVRRRLNGLGFDPVTLDAAGYRPRPGA